MTSRTCFKGLCLTKITFMAWPSKPEFYGDLVYKVQKVMGTSDFSDQIRKITKRYKRLAINVIQQSACLVINPITFDNFAVFLNCTPMDPVSDSMMNLVYKSFLALTMKYYAPCRKFYRTISISLHTKISSFKPQILITFFTRSSCVCQRK